MTSSVGEPILSRAAQTHPARKVQARKREQKRNHVMGSSTSEALKTVDHSTRHEKKGDPVNKHYTNNQIQNLGRGLKKVPRKLFVT